MTDQIIYTINSNKFYIDRVTGDMVLNGEVISHLIALELIEILRHDLYKVQEEQKTNIFSRLFK
jgi:hypothetical protein